MHENELESLYIFIEKGLDDITHGRLEPADNVFDRIEARLRPIENNPSSPAK